MKSVIVVSHDADLHSRRVSDRLEQEGLRPVLLDFDMFPHDVEITYSLSSSDCVVKVLGLTQEEVVGVWWRRPNGKWKNARPTFAEEYIKGEGEVVKKSLFEFFPAANWISDPYATQSAGRKPVQLQLAKELGFDIPLTCISNSPEEVNSFLHSLEGRPAIMKPLASSLVRLAEGPANSAENKVIFTKIIDRSSFQDHLQDVRNCPAIFQEAILKETDLRVTVIDEVVFAAQVDLEGCDDPTNLDWRNYDGKRNYSRHSLPKDVAQKCVEITRRLGLRFGCIDLAFSRDRGYTFFEINPQGQWLPSEDLLGYDITGTLVRSLST